LRDVAELDNGRVLLVEGVAPFSAVLEEANSAECDSVRFGVNKTFTPESHAEYEEWDAMIKGVLRNSTLAVSLEFDVRYAEDVLEFGWDENHRFTSIISVCLPYLRQFGVNTRVRIDDTAVQKTNPGIWTHYLHDLTHPRDMTDWDNARREG